MKTIYTPIAVSSGELPEKYIADNNYSDMVFGYNLEEEIICYYNFKTKEWFNNFGGREKVITWLKKEEVPELTEGEIEKLAEMYAGVLWQPNDKFEDEIMQSEADFIAGYIAAIKTSKV